MAMPRLAGRKEEAARNDEHILAAAKEVFVADPTAPIADVAERAHVGISALYRRYPSKEALLATLCAVGQRIYIAEAERALASTGDPWQAYQDFLRNIVAADTHALSSRLAGTFTPTNVHAELAARLQAAGEALFTRTQQAGAIRPDVSFLDVGCMLEAIAQVRMGDAQRTDELRQRLLTLLIDALHTGNPTALPGQPPTWDEQNARWLPR